MYSLVLCNRNHQLKTKYRLSIYIYTLNTENFFVTVTKDLKISLVGKLKLLLINAIQFDINNNTSKYNFEINYIDS